MQNQTGPVEGVAFGDIALPIRAMLADAIEAESKLRQDPSQFFRRAAVRSFMAAVEGVTWSLKQVCLSAGQKVGLFTVGELALLLDQSFELRDSGEVREIPRFPNTQANIRFALAMFDRVFLQKSLPDYRADGWTAMTEIIKVRHRLVHPKGGGSLDVTDHELARLRVAVAWFVHTIHATLEACQERANAARS